MRVANRVLKLERMVGLNGLSVLDRFERALDQAAFRIAGTAVAAVSKDAPELDQIISEVHYSFTRQLNQPDLENLEAELERIVSTAGGSQ